MSSIKRVSRVASDFSITKFEMNEPRNIRSSTPRVTGVLHPPGTKWTIYRRVRVDNDIPALYDICNSFEEALTIARQRSAELIAMGMDDGYCAICSCPKSYHHDGHCCGGYYIDAPRCGCPGYKIK